MLKGENQKNKAQNFLNLHSGKSILLLPNAWDVLSARIYQQFGFKAIGTTSAGISATLGYPDGQIMSLEDNLVVSKRIIDSTSLPVSVDIEAGYSDSVEGVVNTADAALDIGAAGINLEDSTGVESKPFFEIEEQVEKIKAIRSVADGRGIPLVINLRTDVYVLGEENHKEKFAKVVKRVNSYKEAGADCIFVPDINQFNEEIIVDLVKEIEAPLNIIAANNIPHVNRLEEIGVARLSFGPRQMRTMFAILKKMLKELLAQGTYDIMSADTISYGEINSLLSKSD